MESYEHPDDQFARDARMPLEPQEHIDQLKHLRAYFSDGPRRILDLGCGAGRLLIPLRRDGHHVVGLDHDSRALNWVAEGCGHRDDLVQQDVRDQSLPLPEGPFDAALLLGNTLMELVCPNAFVNLLHRLSKCLSRQGVLIIEDIPGLYWPLLSTGQWGDGLAEGVRMVWSERDTVFALREGAEANNDGPLHPDEPHRRLWTESLLSQTLGQAGWASIQAKDPLVRILRPDYG